MRSLPSIGLLGGVQVAGLTARFFMVVVIARLLSPEEFGRYSALWGVLAWTSVLTVGGWSSVALAQIPKSGITRSRLRRIQRTVLIRGLVIAAAQVPFVMIALKGTSPGEALVLSIALFGMSFGSLLTELLRSQGRVVLARSLNLMAPPVATLLLLIPASRVGITVMAAIMVVGAGWFVLTAALEPIVRRHTTDSDDWSPHFARIYTGIKVAQALMSTGDVLVVALVVDYQEAAFYAVANRVAVLGGMALNIVMMLYGPRLSAAARDPEKLRRMTRRTTLISVAITLPFTVVLAIFHEVILTAFGSEYQEAGSIFLILLLATSVNALFGPVGTVLNVNGQERVYRRIMVISAVIFFPTVAGGAALAGGVGAAIGYLAVTLGWNISTRVVLNYEHGRAHLQRGQRAR